LIFQILMYYKGICQLNCKILMYHRGHLPIELQNINALMYHRGHLPIELQNINALKKKFADLRAIYYCITGGNIASQEEISAAEMNLMNSPPLIRSLSFVAFAASFFAD